MMREILFRGKRLDNGEWVEGAFCQKDCDTLFGDMVDRPSIIKYEDPNSGFWFQVDPNTVGQFTGLTDKNGRKIFEGDIVKITDDNGSADFCDGGSGAVEFFDGLWYVGGQVHNGLYDLNKCYFIEIIGNIYDNPELLNQ